MCVCSFLDFGYFISLLCSHTSFPLWHFYLHNQNEMGEKKTQRVRETSNNDGKAKNQISFCQLIQFLDMHKNTHTLITKQAIGIGANQRESESEAKRCVLWLQNGEQTKKEQKKSLIVIVLLKIFCISFIPIFDCRNPYRLRILFTNSRWTIIISHSLSGPKEIRNTYHFAHWAYKHIFDPI